MTRIIYSAAIAIIAASAAPALAGTLPDADAIEMTRPHEMIVSTAIDDEALAAILAPVDAFYGFWANGSPVLLNRAIGADFIDHTLPDGRPQGPTGPAVASAGFLEAVPDLKVTVVQRLVVGDRVVSHLRFSGHFTGRFDGMSGHGQPVDFIATDIVRVRDGRITDNWHLEDNLTFLRQIDALPG
ncbi:ester cyclase [Croceicoccus sp. Ery5]|uniref:ester cyclase n=1 Tax=Croceicoccus sp. Ery5 TaxID=1703340 RepID=UPI001E4406FC|nr:ester cyclase [Croceicoccus sp. Ery5]